MRPAPLLAALLAVPTVLAGVLLPASAQAAPLPAATSGMDVSAPQCPHGRTRLPATVPDFVVLGVNDGIGTRDNPCFATELRWASAAAGRTRPALELYVNTQHPDPAGASWWPRSNRVRGGATVRNPYGSCRGGDDRACAYVYGASIATDDLARVPGVDPRTHRWWLDVEKGNDWTGGRLRHRAVLEGMVAAFARHGVRTGLYSTHVQWGEIVGSVPATSDLAGLPAWLSAAVTPSGAAVNCTTAPLVPRSRVVLAQVVADGQVDTDLPCARLAADPRPRVHGTAAVGHRLTAVPGAWSPDGVELTYRWLRDGRSIGGATSATYTVRSADRRHRLSVRVTGRLPGYSRGVRESSAHRVR